MEAHGSVGCVSRWRAQLWVLVLVSRPWFFPLRKYFDGMSSWWGGSWSISKTCKRGSHQLKHPNGAMCSHTGKPPPGNHRYVVPFQLYLFYHSQILLFHYLSVKAFWTSASVSAVSRFRLHLSCSEHLMCSASARNFLSWKYSQLRPDFGLVRGFVNCFSNWWGVTVWRNFLLVSKLLSGRKKTAPLLRRLWVLPQEHMVKF